MLKSIFLYILQFINPCIRCQVGAHELGRDYEHCSALLRKLDDLDSDLQVDDTRVTTLCQLADKLLQQGPSQQAASVAARRDAFLGKWRALAGDLQKYRDDLAAALEIHAFNRYTTLSLHIHNDDVSNRAHRHFNRKSMTKTTNSSQFYLGLYRFVGALFSRKGK